MLLGLFCRTIRSCLTLVHAAFDARAHTHARARTHTHTHTHTHTQQEILDAYVTLFETHKHALGWGDKELKIV